MVDCAKCGADLGDHKKSDQISIEVMADEHTYAFWFCKDCDVYTRLMFIDNFLGAEYTLGPCVMRREDGDRCVELIRKCPNRAYKKCKCESHQKFPI